MKWKFHYNEAASPLEPKEQEASLFKKEQLTSELASTTNEVSN